MHLQPSDSFRCHQFKVMSEKVEESMDRTGLGILAKPNITLQGTVQ